MHTEAQRVRIRELNDRFRTTMRGGRVTLTARVKALSNVHKKLLLESVRTFDRFSAAHDPYDEHDFGLVRLHGRKFFWKIDYFDPAARSGSEDPGNPEITMRVLTVMLVNEY